jgi:hypothetical protein
VPARTISTEVALKNFAASLEQLEKLAGGKKKLGVSVRKPTPKKPGEGLGKVKINKYKATDLQELVIHASELSSKLAESALSILKAVAGDSDVMKYLSNLNDKFPQLIVPIAKMIEVCTAQEYDAATGKYVYPYLNKALELIKLLQCLPKKTAGRNAAKACAAFEDNYRKTHKGSIITGAPTAAYLKRVLELYCELMQPFIEFGIIGFLLDDKKYDGMIMVSADNLTPGIAKEVKTLAELFSTLTRILQKIGEGIKA